MKIVKIWAIKSFPIDTQHTYNDIKMMSQTQKHYWEQGLRFLIHQGCDNMAAILQKFSFFFSKWKLLDFK